MKSGESFISYVVGQESGMAWKIIGLGNKKDIQVKSLIYNLANIIIKFTLVSKYYL